MKKSVLDYYFSGWKKCFVYEGVATRKEFWSFIIINALFVLLIGGGSYLWLIGVVADHTSRGGMILVWAYFVFLPLRTFVPVILLLPILSLGIRRMHDIGKSGWWFGGVVAINFIVLPLILIGVYYLSTNLMDDDSWHGVVKVINTILNVFSIAFPTWLCCKPTKIKELPSSSDVMN